MKREGGDHRCWVLRLCVVLGCGAGLNAQTIGTFIGTGSMTEPREMHTSTLLLDGRGLLTGGYLQECLESTATNSAELYDPATGTSTPTGSMGAARFGHTATRLPNGTVLIAGGYVGG